MKRLGALVVTIACGMGVAVSVMTAPASASRGRLAASARFTVTVDGQTVQLDYGQSPIVKSTLDGTVAVPVVLHATSRADFLEEFVLANRVKKGPQKTSDALALGIRVHIGTSSLGLDSTAHECTVRVDQFSASRIRGSFSCRAKVSGMAFVATGTFMAR